MINPLLVSKLSLESKVAVVTGAGGGIGHGIAISLARAGAAVIAGDLVPERAEEVAQAIKNEGGNAIGVAMDVMDADQLTDLINLADSRFGRLDILVNNAGGCTSRPFLEQSRRSWQRHIDLNLMSVLIGTATAVPIMIRGGKGGAIINVTSIEGSRAAPTFAVYAACKAGVENFTKSMALELGEHNIRTNVIAPDHTLSPGTMGNRTGPVDRSQWRQRTPEEINARERVIPLGREGIEEECGEAAVFLASDLASYITGIVLPVDGGTSASFGWLKGTDGKWTLNEGFQCIPD